MINEARSSGGSHANKKTTSATTITDLSYTETIQSLVKSNPDWFVPASVKTVLSFAFLWGITTCTMPHVTMTTLTYKDTQTLQVSEYQGQELQGFLPGTYI